jgi:serine/threonine-protein kinase HipA
MTEREILVLVDLHGQAVPAGRLFMRTLRGRESATFEYDQEWLAHPQCFALDPLRLPLARGAFHTAGGEKLFPGLTDSAPDRWGRNLMARQARLEGRKDTLFESDYMLMVDDATRMGAVRLKLDPEGPFVAHGSSPIPPLLRLGELLQAADAVQAGEDDSKALQLLLAPGSSLGGARPKASIIDQRGHLSIAKFPASTDEWSVTAWEHVACELARAAGIDVAATRLVDVAGRKVLVSRRFDRDTAGRIPFLSALALVGAGDGDRERSYFEIADALRQYGVRVDHNLTELWRRMVFNVLISNTDDHLRNHGVVREPGGWVLAPAFDLNPFPTDVRPRIHALALDEASHEASLDTVLGASTYFGQPSKDARRLVRRMAEVVGHWRTVARAAGIQSADIERMSSAFEHDDLQQAMRLPA